MDKSMGSGMGTQRVQYLVSHLDFQRGNQMEIQKGSWMEQVMAHCWAGHWGSVKGHCLVTLKAGHLDLWMA